jgi:hypothetical protein
MSGKLTLAEQIDAKRAELRALEAEAALSCAHGRHKWAFVGGCNAGCETDCGCSVPVHRCETCGDYDYGENDEAVMIRGRCAILNGAGREALRESP